MFARSVYALPAVSAAQIEAEEPDQLKFSAVDISQNPVDGRSGSADGVPEFATEQLGGREHLCDLRGRIDTGLMGQSDTGLMGQSENGLSGHSGSYSFWPQTHSEKSDVVQSISNCESSNEDWTPFLAKIRSGAIGKPSIRISGLVQGVPATILIDCGAERDCVSERFLKCNSIKYVKNLPELSVRVADGRINKCGLLSTAQLQLGSYRDCGDFAVT